MKTKKTHCGIPYSEKNPTHVPLCQLQTGALRMKCGVGLWTDFQVVGIDDLDQVDCQKCRAELAKRLRKAGW